MTVPPEVAAGAGVETAAAAAATAAGATTGAATGAAGAYASAPWVITASSAPTATV